MNELCDYRNSCCEPVFLGAVQYASVATVLVAADFPIMQHTAADEVVAVLFSKGCEFLMSREVVSVTCLAVGCLEYQVELRKSLFEEGALIVDSISECQQTDSSYGLFCLILAFISIV